MPPTVRSTAPSAAASTGARLPGGALVPAPRRLRDSFFAGEAAPSPRIHSTASKAMDPERSKLRREATSFVPKAKPRVQQRDVAPAAPAASAALGSGAAAAPPPASDQGTLEELSSLHGVSAEQMERDMDEIYRHMLLVEAQQRELVFDAQALEVVEGKQQFPPAEWELEEEDDGFGAPAPPGGVANAGRAGERPWSQARTTDSTVSPPATAAFAASGPAQAYPSDAAHAAQREDTVSAQAGQKPGPGATPAVTYRTISSGAARRGPTSSVGGVKNPYS